MKKITIIQTCLQKDCKTALIGEKALEIGKEKRLDISILDLRDYDIEFCDGRKMEDYNSDMNKIKDIIESSDAYILAYPIYNYSFSGVCKNFIDLYSYYMDSKPCSIIQNGYSVRSYSDGYGELNRILGLYNNINIPLPIVHAANEDFDGENISNNKVVEKLEKMIENLIK